uniref:Importin-11 n=1 Tax=Eptatretus burgeri TaxID=7764 RepID=A0A8C4NCP5_EPTBU
MDPSQTRSVVTEVLRRATSQDCADLKPAEEQLRQWETQPGFYSILLSIFTNHEVPVNVRWLAVLYFKNGIDRYWRRLAPNSLVDEEKTSLRAGLIANFNEPVNQVATQVAVLIAKVARLDYPRQWPELIPCLLNGVRAGHGLAQHRALLTLHHVTKTLATKRLANDRHLFVELASSIYGFTCSLWMHHTERFLQATQTGDETADALEHMHLTLKVLRKLTIYGFPEPHMQPEAMEFLNAIFGRTSQFLDCLCRLPLEHGCRERLEKSIILCTKVLLDMVDQHAFSFVPFLSRTLEFAGSFIFGSTAGKSPSQRFLVQCMSLVKLIIKNELYKVRKDPSDANPKTLEALRLKEAFFQPTTLSQMCQKLVTYHLLLTSDDLDMWDEDPEGFAIEESGGDSWKYSLRPCTEVLFLDLFHEYSGTLTLVLLNMLQTLQVPTDPADSTSLLVKDAVYNAVGLAAHELFDAVDFDSWFSDRLVTELQVSDPRYKVIRRRVTWLVGQWLAVKFKADLRPMLYTVLLSLLQDQDLVVCLEAVSTLKLAVDDFDFKTEQFTLFLEPTFGLLFGLLRGVSDCDTKMHILNVISIVVERVGAQIRPHAGALIQYLPELWRQSEEHNMLRCAILSTLQNLVKGLGAQSMGLYAFLLPILQFSTDLNQLPHVYLLEDALDLWQMTLEHCQEAPPELLQLFHNMLPIIDLGSENQKMCFQIITGYILLAPTQFLQSYGRVLCNVFCNLLSDISSEGLVLILKVVETAVRVTGEMGAVSFESLLPTVLKGILDQESYPVKMAAYLGILGRLLVQARDVLSTLLTQMAFEVGQKAEELLGKLIDVWVDKLDNITQPERRKLSALAVASLLPSQSSTMHDRFCSIVNICVEALHDIMMEDPEGGPSKDRLVIPPEEIEFGEELEEPTEQDKRKRILASADPVHTTSLQVVVVSKMRAQQELLGLEAFQNLLSTVDNSLLQQLQEFMAVG